MNMKRIYIFISIIIFGTGFLTSCDEFFKQESDDVLYADKEHLDNAVDTVFSVIGILNKLQVIADRTILLGEVRGDLVDLTTAANSDLREMANFEVGDDNRYNVPSDYYAIINNCNYFIAHADTALRSNRNEIIFMKEYAAVKAIRAWVYLQLVLNYGQIPFVTEPMLSKEEAEEAEQGTKADLQTVCSYFIDDLAKIPERYNTEYPGYGSIGGNESRLFFFPLSIIRGELYLWRASATGNKEDYKQAALHYFKYISERNGMNSVYPTLNDCLYWSPRNTSYDDYNGTLYPIRETVTSDAELITMIAGDEVRSKGTYSELRNLFCSREENDRKVSISPSVRVDEISSAQVYCQAPERGTSVVYVVQQLPDHKTGDLRLAESWIEDYDRDRYTKEMTPTQYITKYASRGGDGSANVHIYRRTMVYLRMAEALNMAGYPRMAFKILSEGLNNTIIQNEVMPYYDSESKADSIYLSKFDFNPVRYQVITIEDYRGNPAQNHNMMGIHTRGSGWTPLNEFYSLPEADPIVIDIEPGEEGSEEDPFEDIEIITDFRDTPELITRQQEFVDSLILDESALEFAFEGTRYYDIMRYAMRQSNPGQAMAKIIGARLGEANRSSMSAIMAKLADQRNWYLSWKGKIGMK
jgi:hypothetical protein